MDILNNNIIRLQNEVAYYKKQLNIIAGSVVSRDYRVAEMNNEIKQLKTGFALLAALNQFKSVTNIEDVYDHFTERINIDLQNDLSFILQQVPQMLNHFGVHFIKGNSKVDTSAMQHQQVYIDTSFIEQKKSLLFNSQTETTPFIHRMIQTFGIPYFILSPIIVNDQLVAYIFTGRKVETVLFASSRLLIHDVHTLEAIAGVIAAIKNQHDQFELLVKERTRISNDMHDDIGAGLTQITLISESAKRNTQNNAELESIAITSRQLVNSMSEIIWSMNKENKTLGQQNAYLREQLHKQLEYAGVAYQIELTESGNSILLNNEQKRNILLITKELVNNAIKYSKAKNISVQSSFNNGILTIEVKDDGVGFDTTKNFNGNGLRNIQHRIKEMNGSINICALHNKGSSFTCYLLLK